MRKIISIIVLFCALINVSCTKDNTLMDLPQIYFEQPRYILGKGEVTIRLMADVEASKKLEVPFTFAGTVERDSDFTCADKSFVFEAGTKEATITLTRVEKSIQDDAKTLIVNLGSAPEGFRLGVVNFASVDLFGNQSVFITFNNEADKLTESGTYNVSLERMNGKRYNVTEETQFPVEIDPASTAVEGVHFQFEQGKYVTVKRNRNVGSISLKFLKKEEGKDKLILRIKDKEGFAFGTNRAIDITIQGPYSLLGTWSFMKISNYDWFKYSFEGIIPIANFPKGTAEDKITFKGNQQEYTFTPDIKGDLKNFFIAPCKATYTGEELKDFQELATLGRYQDEAAIVVFDKVNVNFSATHQKIRESKLGFRIITIDGEEILECTIDDFEPTDFLAEGYEYMGVMTDLPLRLHFKKVK